MVVRTVGGGVVVIVRGRLVGRLLLGLWEAMRLFKLVLGVGWALAGGGASSCLASSSTTLDFSSSSALSSTSAAGVVVVVPRVGRVGLLNVFLGRNGKSRSRAVVDL